MPVSLTFIEAQRFATGKARAFSRVFADDRCPYKIGDVVVLAEGSRELAAVAIKGIREDTFADRAGDDALAADEGFASCVSWKANAIEKYGKLVGTKKVFRFTFVVQEVSESLGGAAAG